MVCVSSHLADHEVHVVRDGKVSLARRSSAERYKVQLLCRYTSKWMVGFNCIDRHK